MTTSGELVGGSVPVLTSPRPGAEETALLVVVLGLALALRSVSTAGFVAVLGAGAALSRWRPARPAPAALAWGVAGAAVLVVGPAGRALATARAAALVAGHAGAFLPWGAAVAVVVCAEEAFLRGALWRACARWRGEATALVVTSAAFGLVHVPLYGWRALPLDALVGLVLGGLRLASGSVAAPALAHLVADWAGWWLA